MDNNDKAKEIKDKLEKLVVERYQLFKRLRDIRGEINTLESEEYAYNMR